MYAEWWEGNLKKPALLSVKLLTEGKRLQSFVAGEMTMEEKVRRQESEII